MEYCLVVQQGFDKPEISVILSYETQKVTKKDFFRAHVKDYRSLSSIVGDFETVIKPSCSLGHADKVCMFFSGTDKDNIVMTLLRYFNLSHPSQKMVQ